MKLTNIIISLLLGLGIIYLAWQRLQFAEERRTTYAVVTDISPVKNQQPGTALNQQITVLFNTSRHETHQAAFMTKKELSFAIGDTIEIFFSPKNMQQIAWKNE